MAKLADQVEELEDNLASAEHECDELRDRVRVLEDDASDRESELDDLQEYVSWIDETYPEARTAYDAKRRLDEASSVV